MKTDTELEALLRATLTTHAQDVHEAAVVPAVTELQRAARRRMPTWLPMLAAAAAVLIVTAGVIIGIRATRSTPPTHPTPRPTNTVAPNSLHALRCRTPLPSQWQHALTAGRVTDAGKRLSPLAVDDAGDVLADQSADVALPDTHQLVIVNRSGTIRLLYGVAPPASWHGMRIGSVGTAGQWVAFGLEVQASSGGQGPVQIELANIGSGKLRTLRPTTPTDVTIVLGPIVFGTAVYWTEIRAAEGLGYGPLYRYDIATGRRTVLDAHAASAPLVTGQTVSWQHDGGQLRMERPGGFLPAGFDATAALHSGSALLHDGDVYAWQDPANLSAILAEPSGSRRPTRVVPQREGGRLAGLTGSFLWWDAGVVDLRTGAATRLGTAGQRTGTAVIAAGHTAAVSVGSSGLAVLDTSRLPGLRC